MDKAVISVQGMSCSHCESAVNKAISALNGVTDVHANAASNSVVVQYDSNKVTNKDLKDAILDAGYEIIEEKSTYTKSE